MRYVINSSVRFIIRDDHGVSPKCSTVIYEINHISPRRHKHDHKYNFPQRHKSLTLLS